MGTYDVVHDGSVHVQTKALGRWLRDLIPGDEAWLVPAVGYAFRDDDVEDTPRALAHFAASALDSTESRNPAPDWYWIVVRNQRITELTLTAPSDLPLFGYFGQFTGVGQVEVPVPIAADVREDWRINPRLTDPYFRRPEDQADLRSDQAPPLDLDELLDAGQDDAFETDWTEARARDQERCQYCEVALLRRAEVDD